MVHYSRLTTHLWPDSYGAFPLHGTVQYGSLSGGFSTGYSTWYCFSTASAGVPSDPYHYQNVTCKLYWSLIGWRTSSLLRHWTCDTRPNIDPLDLNQNRQRSIGHNFCINPNMSVETFLSLIAEERIQLELRYILSALCIFFVFSCYIFTFVCVLLQLKSIWSNKCISRLY